MRLRESFNAKIKLFGANLRSAADKKFFLFPHRKHICLFSTKNLLNLNKGNATYINKEKALNYLRISAPIAEAQNNQALVSATNIVRNFKTSVSEEENSSSPTKTTAGRSTFAERREMAAAVEDKPKKLYGNKVIKKMKKHGFTLDELKDLPAAVADPITVLTITKRTATAPS